MLFTASFFVELFLLFLLSKQLTVQVAHFLFRFTKSRNATIYLMALLFFPGTVIHELSHFFMAQFVFVQTGKIDLFPVAEEGNVKLGSVAVARSDPFRRLLIGMAPFLFGTALLLTILYLAVLQNWFVNIPLLILLIYILFEVGNTMFSSRKDMEGALELIAVVIILAVVFYLIGVRIPALNLQLFFATPIIREIFQQGSLYLLAPLGIDIVIIGVLKLIKR